MDFVSRFPDTAVLDILGDSITHVTPSGILTETKVVMEFDVLIDESSSQTQTQCEMLKEAFIKPLRRGDKIIHNRNIYLLDSPIKAGVQGDDLVDGKYERWGLIDG